MCEYGEGVVSDLVGAVVQPRVHLRGPGLNIVREPKSLVTDKSITLYDLVYTYFNLEVDLLHKLYL